MAISAIGVLLCYNPVRVMPHNLRHFASLFGVGLLLIAADAQASRLAIVAMPSTHGQAPVEEADALTTHLLARRHRTTSSADATERLRSGNSGAGADWAAQAMETVRRGREALTRLDRHGAEQARRQVKEAIDRVGGGAGGPDVVVAWALLESALAASAGDVALAGQWMERAASMGPNVVLDPLIHPESEREAFEAAARRARGRTPGSLELVTVPVGANLWVDGTKRCTTACAAPLPPGRHFVLVTSPAHAPAAFSVDLVSGQSVSRRVGLTSAYTGASLGAIRSMLDNPSRLAEAQSSLTAIARFLDVDHVVVLRRGKSETLSVRVAPPLAGNDAFRGGLSTDDVFASAEAMLRQPVGKSPAGTANDGAWYESTALWVGVATVAAVAVGGGLLLTRGDDSGPPSHGTLIIGGP